MTTYFDEAFAPFEICWMVDEYENLYELAEMMNSGDNVFAE
jgi:hypothetical protein